MSAPKTARSRKLRRLVNRIHLWAALTGSLPAVLLCLSGLILVFEPELQKFEERAAIAVTAQESPLTHAELAVAVEQTIGHPVTYLRFPRSPDQAALVATSDKRYHFVDPYTGVIQKTTEVPAKLMRAVRVFHTQFFMGELGTWIGIVSSLFLVSLCITGCYLFLKRKLKVRTLLRIRWTPISRRHYDLHAVLGIVSAVPILLIALSGALIGLNTPWRETILFLTDSEWKQRPKLEIPTERSEWNFEYDDILQTVQEAAPENMYIEAISLPTKSDRPLRLRLLYPYATRPASWAFVDPRDGALIEFHHHWDFEPGHLIHRLNRGFHSGELYTDAMRWLWFALMIVPAVLAYTGYRQWRFKNGPKRSGQKIAIANPNTPSELVSAKPSATN